MMQLSHWPKAFIRIPFVQYGLSFIAHCLWAMAGRIMLKDMLGQKNLVAVDEGRQKWCVRPRDMPREVCGTKTKGSSKADEWI